MNTGEIFESGSGPDCDSDLSNCSFKFEVTEEEDVGANVVLSAVSSPAPKQTAMRVIKVISSNVLPINGVKANQNIVATKSTEPLRSVVVPNVVEGYLVVPIKEEIVPKNEPHNEMTVITQDRKTYEAELTGELGKPSMKEVVEYEVLYPGGPVDQVKVEQITEEHDYVPVPEPLQEYYCGVCNKSYTSAKSVRQHMTRLHGFRSQVVVPKKRYPVTKKVVCELCGKKYASAAALRYHQRTHTGEKPYQCPQCPKAFTMPLFFQLHWRTHTGERPYSCESCPKKFGNQAALLRHNRVHTGIKPYTCEECGRSFSQSNSKKLHVRTVHLKEPAPYMSKKRRLRQLMKNGGIKPEMDTEAEAETQPEYLQKLECVLKNDLLRDSFVDKYDKSDDD